MELRSSEEEIQSLITLYESLYKGKHAFATEIDVPALPQLPERATASSSPDNAGDLEKTAVEFIEGLDSFRGRMDALQEVMDKFRKRLTLRDPITDKPRYGEQTSQRVATLLERYQDLCQVLELVFGTKTSEETTTTTTTDAPAAPIVDYVRKCAAKEIEEKQRLQEEERLLALAEDEARLNAIEQARQEQEEAAAAIARQEREAAEALSAHAAGVRLAVQRAQEQATETDRAWVDSIPNRKTLQGVKEQLQIFSECSMSNTSALNALYTMFSQIAAHPEEVKFRRIRRDHPRFMQDIGQYAGGKELIIAAGFELGFVEEIPSYVCREPDVEKDLDGWKTWYDLLKGTLEIIEQEMIK